MFSEVKFNRQFYYTSHAILFYSIFCSLNEVPVFHGTSCLKQSDWLFTSYINYSLFYPFMYVFVFKRKVSNTVKSSNGSTI